MKVLLQLCFRENLFSCLIMAVLLTGCAHSDHYVPVGFPGKLSGSHYLVQRGDTLYSIAFRFGLDYKSVAKANHIDPPYTIFINQKVRIAGIKPDNKPDSKPEKSSVKSNKNKLKEKEKVVVKNSVSPGIPKTSFSNKFKLDWVWPLKGEVVKGFSLKGDINKGIDISGKVGESVISAEEGVVVYAGGGLRGYGKLVIVKHNDSYLSAYGNNDKLLVKEGQKVKAGDRLARIGGVIGGVRGGARGGVGKDKPFLHFEIRRDGKPLNPLTLLPKNRASGIKVARDG